MLQPVSSADYPYCWLPAGGSDGLVRHNIVRKGVNSLWPTQTNTQKNKKQNMTWNCTLEPEFRPSVAAPCGSGDAEVDRGWQEEGPRSLSSLERKTWDRNKRAVRYTLLQLIEGHSCMQFGAQKSNLWSHYVWPAMQIQITTGAGLPPSCST